MTEGISVDSLIDNSTYEVLEYYNSEKVKAYSIGIRVFLQEYRDIEHDLLTNKYFHIHLDISKRWDTRTIDVINLTPKLTEAGSFIQWVQENLGYNFLSCYYKEMFRIIDEEHGEHYSRRSGANYF